MRVKYININFKRIKFRKNGDTVVDKASIVFRYTLNGK